MLRRRFVCFALLLVALLAGFGLYANSAHAQDKPGPDYAWTQWGPTGLIARVATTAATCPQIDLDGAKQPMQVHAQPQSPDFPVLVCEAAIPATVTQAHVGGQALPVRHGAPKRVVIIGDTGCRLSDKQSQACNDPAAWPYAALAAQAAAFKPDLVIHVGDYNYREAPCPAGNTGCTGSPYGQNWPTWSADVFAPAQPLLAAAPWIFVRGNHETCERGGVPYFHLLDPRPVPATCADYSDPYSIKLGDLNLIVFDAANADDYKVDETQVPIYQLQFDAVRKLASGYDWLLIHKPVYAVGRANATTTFVDQPTLQAASGDKWPVGLQAMFSGHLHAYQSLDFTDGAPAQVLVGNSGTALDPELGLDLSGYKIGTRTVNQGRATSQFGYLEMEADGPAWKAVLRGLGNHVIGDCRLDDGAFTCSALAAPPVAAEPPGKATAEVTPEATLLPTPTAPAVAATPPTLPATGGGESTGLLLVTVLLSAAVLAGLALAERVRGAGF